MRLKDWFFLAAILYPWGLGCLTLALLLGGNPRMLTVGFVVYMSPVYLYLGFGVYRLCRSYVRN